MKLICLLATLLPLTALANWKEDPTHPDNTPAEASATSEAIAIAKPIATAIAQPQQGQQQGQSLNNANEANNEGISLSTGDTDVAISERNRALAIGLAAATAAPIDTRVCLRKQTRGIDLRPVPVAMTGNNKYDMDCVEEERDRRHCTSLADRYAAWGQVALAVAQLERCGGVEDATLVYPADDERERRLQDARFQDEMRK
jgi:hypothetical protein